MFAYCENNPVNRIDPNGKSWIALGLVLMVGIILLVGCEDNPPADYVEENSPDQNCYSYAFDLPHAANPGENSSIKLCKKDKYIGSDLGLELYSNQFIPLTVETDMLNRIRTQGKLDAYFSGGSVLHLNVTLDPVATAPPFGVALIISHFACV